MVCRQAMPAPAERVCFPASVIRCSPSTCQHLVELGSQGQDFTSVNFNVGRLSLETTQRLMNHDPRVRQAESLTLGPCSQQKSPHARGLSNTQCAHVRLYELHGVVDGHPRRDGPAGRVDIEENVFVRVLRFKKEQLRDDQVGRDVIDWPHEKYHPLPQEARIDIVGSLATSALLDDHGDQPQALRLPVTLCVRKPWFHRYPFVGLRPHCPSIRQKRLLCPRSWRSPEPSLLHSPRARGPRPEPVSEVGSSTSQCPHSDP